MYEFVVEADRIISFDGRIVEQFWRGTNPGSSKWRIHQAHVGAEISSTRKADVYRVHIGERYSGRVAADIQFDVAASRLAEIQAFLATFAGA